MTLQTIKGIGPAVEKELNNAGITSADQLYEIGADDAYRKMLASGTRPHFIGYYALHMAVQGRPWNDCKGEEKEKFRKRFDALLQGDTDRPGSELQKFLSDMGLA